MRSRAVLLLRGGGGGGGGGGGAIKFVRPAQNVAPLLIVQTLYLLLASNRDCLAKTIEASAC